ncbi:MAG: serine/threonine-protein kinase [Myxococcota bacterium]
MNDARQDLGQPSPSDQITQVGDESPVDPFVDPFVNPDESPACGCEARAPASGGSCTLGRYVLIGPLGCGGMGHVYEAFDPELGRRVALKVLHEDLGARHTHRLRREAQALAKLSHPNVVQVYEVGEAQGQTFVAMELVKGQTLDRWGRSAPSWRQCVEIFVQVGAGLAAAHEQGLVHRDFKPSNAMVDTKGRALVLDFGLAREVADDSSTIDSECARSRALSSSELVVTNGGGMLGTPAYMPPEQMMGAHASALSDQFSYCVALFEAVYGERPFVGDSMAELMYAVVSGQLRPVPRGSAVPATLRGILRRGLLPDPQARWPSMEVLLERLHRVLAPRARRGRWLGLGVIVGLGGAGMSLTYSGDGDPPCRGASAPLGEVWGDSQIAQVESAITGTALSYAPATWNYVQAQLDGYARDWSVKATQVCEATRVTQAQSEAVMDLRMACLYRSKTELDAAVRLLAHADDAVVGHAVSLVDQLPVLSQCDDVERLQQQRQRMPPPEDPEVWRQVEEVRTQLPRLTAMGNTGRHVEALAQVESVSARAEELGYGPLQAEVRLVRGTLLERSGRYADAQRELSRTYAQALAHEHEPVALGAAQQLTRVAGYWLDQHAAGLAWGQTALPLAERSGDELQVAKSSKNVGAVKLRQGDYDHAQRLHERALEIRQRRLGPDHPDVALSLNDLGKVALKKGDYASAKSYHQRALAIYEAALGSDHPKVAYGLTTLGAACFMLGDHEQAQRHHQRALRLKQNNLGPEHPKVGVSMGSLGRVLLSQGQPEQAKRHFQRALRIFEASLPADHPRVAYALMSLANVALRQGHFGQAREHAERAVSILEAGDSPSEELAAARFRLAQALWTDPGQRDRARAYAVQARDAWAEFAGRFENDRAQVEGWLADKRAE